MAFNAGACNPGHTESIGTAISDHGWRGPWRLLSKNAVFDGIQGGNYQPTPFYPHGKGHGAEDP